jgi:hypothetical protein
VLRGGYGVFYNLFDRVGSEDQIALNLPGLVNKVYPTASAASGPIFLLRNGFPANPTALPNLDPAAGQLRTIRTRAVSHDAPKSTFQQASIGFQRELMRNVVLTFDGVWSKGTNLASLVNLNQNLPGTLDANGPLPYPNFGFIEWRAQNGKSDYKGLDVGLEKRFSNSHGFGVSYTLGNSKDNTSEHLTTQGSNSFPQNSRDFSAWYGPSDYDVRHRLAVNFVAELAAREEHGRQGLDALGDLRVAVGPSLHGESERQQRRHQHDRPAEPDRRPRLRSRPQLQLRGRLRGVVRWFNPAAFQSVPSGSFGNEGRNLFRGPSWSGLDLSLQKRIELRKSVGATLRWDIFNVFNHTNFGLPNRNISDAAVVGTITSLSGDPRIMQLSLRLAF